MNTKRFLPWIGLAVVLVIAVIAVVLLTSPAPASSATIQRINGTQYQEQFSSASHTLVDVRTEEEFVSGYIPGSVNISLQTISGRLNEIPRDQPVVLYCRSGNRSAQAAELLAEAGFTQIYDLGGIIDWQSSGYPVTR